MAEKYKCVACYKKYSLAQTKSCPQCETPAQLDPNLSPNEIEAFLLTGSEDESTYSISLEDLEEEVSEAKRGVRSLASAFLMLIISMIIGGFIYTLGTTEQVACVLQRRSCSGGTSTVGLIILAVGLLSSLSLAISALISSRRR